MIGDFWDFFFYSFVILIVGFIDLVLNAWMALLILFFVVVAICAAVNAAKRAR